MAKQVQLATEQVVGGDFRVVCPLSAGGMGAVYVVEQLSTGKRRALKVMHPQLVADDKLRERFEREARVGALINSDHVVQVIGAGVEDSGLPWIAMELLDGQDLAEFIASHGRVTAAELHAILEQLCHALGAAHEADVVHRDIKPENVFVAASQSPTAPTTIKVLDFGIAKVAAQASTTATGRLGSPAWMAPEQTDPRAAITPATDVWAVGLLSFWMLTGMPFWLLAGDHNSSMHALMREILFDDIPSASARADELGVLDLLPPGFDAWFARSVIRDATQRYPNARAQLDGFGEHIGETTSHVTIPPPSKPGSFTRGSTARITGSATSDRIAVDVDPSAETAVSAPTAPLASRTTSSLVSDRAPDAQRSPELARKFRPWPLALAAVAIVGAGYLALRTPAPGSAPAAASAAVSAAASAPDAASAAVSASAPDAPASASASAPLSAPAPRARKPAPSSAAPADRPPFDFQLVQKRGEMLARSAGRMCAYRKGPRALVVTLTYHPSGGGPRSVVAAGPPSALDMRSCVKAPFWSLRVKPFAPPAVKMSFSVQVAER